jgi:DNA topoisomerase VI subunit B
MPEVNNEPKSAIQEGAQKIKEWISEQRKRENKSRTAEVAMQHIEEMLAHFQRYLDTMIRPQIVSSRRSR